jgi:hypothetical protein
MCISVFLIDNFRQWNAEKAIQAVKAEEKKEQRRCLEGVSEHIYQ